MGFFKFKKAYAVVLALAMVVSPLNIQGSTAHAASKSIKNVSIKIGSKNVTKKTFKMTKGNTKKMKVLVKPASSKKAVTFKSSSKKIVQVSKKGKLTAKKAGTAKITVKVKGKNGQNKSTWVKIKVVKKNPVVNPDTQENNNTTEPDNTQEPYASTAPEASSVPETSISPEGTAAPAASTTPAASATPDTSATPAASATPVPSATPVSGGIPLGGGASLGGGGSSSGGNAGTTSQVTVNDAESLQKELSKASLPGKIIYKSEKAEKVEIPASIKANNTSLVVDAPNATITNNAVFKDIQINAISPDTWFEKATGNKIRLAAKKSHVCIGTGASLDKLEVNNGVEDVSIENDGLVKGISVSASANIRITGSNHTKIPFEAGTQAEGAVVNTTIPLVAEVSARITLQLRFGADQMTSVTIINISVMPVIQGIGIIPVTNKQDNTTTQVVAGTPDGFDVTDGTVSTYAAITGTVNKADAAGTKPLAGAKVYMVSYDASLANADSIISKAEAKYTTTTSTDGKYDIKNIEKGNYFLVVRADGLKDYIKTVILNKELYYNEDITMVTPDGKGNIEGVLNDAIIQDGVVKAALTLELRKEAGNIYGDIVAITTSDANTGRYKFENLETGTYTIYVKDTREDKVYSDASATVTVLPGGVIKNITISRIDTKHEGQLQFILSWSKAATDGSVSSDLDSHLTGPGAGEDKFFHTYFSDKEYHANGERYADLDRDDTDYEGPETTTVRKESDGLYHFYIHDFANSYEYNTKITTSKPMVEVYVEGTNIEQYSVPEGIGNVWDVCTYDTITDTLTAVNKIYYFPSLDSLGSLSSAKYYLKDIIDEIKNSEFNSNTNVIALLNEAQGILDTSGDFTETVLMYTRLKSIQKATGIGGISFTGQYGSYDTYTEDGVSVIEARGNEDVLPEDLKVTPSSTDATCELMASDKDGYAKKAVITNNLIGITQTYYILYKQYIRELEYIDNVKDGNNYISDWYTEGKYIYIYGAADSLTNPVLVFDNEEVTSVYEPVTGNEDYTGKFIVSYKNHTKEYFVKYFKERVTIRLNDIFEDGNVFNDIDYGYVEDASGTEYKVYYVEGRNEKLGTNTSAEGVTYKFNVEPESVQVTPAGAENTLWDFVLDVTYMDETQEIYIKYTQKNISILPDEYETYYTDENGDSRYIDIVIDAPSKQVTLCKSGFNSWDTLKFNGYKSNVSYEVKEENGTHYLLIKAGNTEIDKYTIIVSSDEE